MHVSYAALASVALLASSVAAAPSVPTSPQTSLLGSAQLKREIQRRQVTTADLKRRKNQPKRKRADPSAPVCARPAADNLIINGDFETSASSATPWTLSTVGPSANLILTPTDNFGYTTAPPGKSIGIAFQENSNEGASGRIEQAGISVCAGYGYNLQFDLGRAALGGGARISCEVVVTVAEEKDGGQVYTVYSGSPCAGTDCPNPNGFQDTTYGSFSSAGLIGPFSSATVKVAWDISCPGYTGATASQVSYAYATDNYVLTRET